jgi:UDP-glucose 4-epimerase
MVSDVLVTGGAGFLGSNLVERLVGSGYNVTVLDDLSTGKLENLSRYRDRFRFCRGDVRDPGSVMDALQGKEAVIHLAAVASVERSVQDPLGVEEINVLGTLNLLKASLEHKLGRFVYASSCAVYGDVRRLPVSEEEPTRPISPYAVSKLAAENYCTVFQRVFGLETVCLRFFNAYGQRQTYGPYSGVITRFMEMLRRGEALTIEGDGEQTRDFINVRDVVEACTLALTRKGVTGEVLNIGSGTMTTINELARLMSEIAGAIAEPIRLPPRKGDIKHIYADITKSRRMLGFEPVVPLKQGLSELFDLSLKRQS